MPSFAGVSLCQSTPELASFISTRISTDDVIQLSPVPYLDRLRPALPYPDQLRRPIKLGSLYWPQGGTRWAVGHFIATELQLRDIRAIVYPSTYTTLQALPLVLDDGLVQITADMFMLPPRPIAQTPFVAQDLTKWLLPNGDQIDLTNKTGRPDEGVYLLSFVDERFYWWQRPSTVSITKTTTWENLIEQIADDLEIEIDVDPIPDAYLQPTDLLVPWQQYLPLLLDLVAFNIGMRVVRDWKTGNVSLQAPRTALASIQAQLAANSENRMAGGLFAFDVDESHDQSDLPPIIPAAVQVVFETNSSTVPTYGVTVELADLDTLTEFDGPGDDSARTVNGDATMILPYGATAEYDMSGLTNGDELQALAEQAATDFYLWELSKLDIVFAGLCQWTPEGASDGIEWIHRASPESPDGMVLTRVQRASYYTFQDSKVVSAPAGKKKDDCCTLPSHSWCISGGQTFIGAMIHATANQTIQDSDITEVVFDEVVYDTSGMVVGNQFNLPLTGKWLVGCQIAWELQSDGNPGYRLVQLSGQPSPGGLTANVIRDIILATASADNTLSPGNGTTNQSLTAVFFCQGGTNLSVNVKQNSGSPLDLYSPPDIVSLDPGQKFWCVFLG